MISDNINRKAILDVYKNAHIAMQSISNLLPEVNDLELKNELLYQFDGYKSFIDEVDYYLKEKGIEPEDINLFQKTMMKGAIKFKTMIDASRNHVADMMIKGSVMGINELAQMNNESKNYDKEIADFIARLLNLEEEYERRLKKFL